MTAITRRAAFGAIASASSSLALVTAAAAAELGEAHPPAEIPVQKVNRLAAELADAMDEWMADISHPDYQRALWVAHVWPSSTGRGIYFRNEGDAVQPTPQKRLENAIAELKEAAEAVDPNIYDWIIRTPEGIECSVLMAAFRTTTKYDGDGWYKDINERTDEGKVLVEHMPERDRDGQRCLRVTSWVSGRKARCYTPEKDFNKHYGPKLS